jgi:hypothetical protein
VLIRSGVLRHVSVNRQGPAFPVPRKDSCRQSGAAALPFADVLALLCLIFFSFVLVRHAHAQTVNSAGAQAPRPWGQNPDGMHIYIWAGLKSHFAGQHDYPQFLADWSKLLTEHGAVVDEAANGCPVLRRAGITSREALVRTT